MFDWLGDIFNSDTFDTLSKGFDTFQGAAKSAAPYVQGGLGLLSGLEGMRNQRNLANARGQTVQQLQDIFSPGGNYAQELRRQLERRDAAAGRRSQYGNRETELMAQLAKSQAGVLTNPQYAANLVGANTSAYGPLMGALGKLFQQQQQSQQGSKKKNFQTPPGTRQAADYLSDSLFSATPDTAISSLGGAGDYLAGSNTPAALGNPDLLGSLSGNDPYLPKYNNPSDSGGGIFNGYGSTEAGNLAASEGLGAASGALSGGIGSGALGTTVGGADTLGALLGGTGYLPGYAAAGGEAGAGLFGSAAGGAAAGEAAGAGAGAAGGSALGAGAGAEGAGALGAGGGAGLAAGAVALPFALAIGGMLNGIFGSPDGPPGSYRDIVNEAAGQTWNPETGSIAPDITDWVNQQGGMDMQHKYYNNDIMDVDKYMREKYGNPTNQGRGLGGWSDDQYQQAYNDYFQPRFLANQPTWLSQRE